MNERASAKGDGEAKAGPSRKPYHKPVVQEFGKLHLLTQGTGGSVGDGSSAMLMAPSDRAIKENIHRVGTHPLGIGVYLFSYRAGLRELWGHGRRLGVMADEVEAVLPEAVSVHPDGYRMVDYSMLRPRPAIQ